MIWQLPAIYKGICQITSGLSFSQPRCTFHQVTFSSASGHSTFSPNGFAHYYSEPAIHQEPIVTLQDYHMTFCRTPPGLCLYPQHCQALWSEWPRSHRRLRYPQKQGNTVIAEGKPKFQGDLSVSLFTMGDSRWMALASVTWHDNRSHQYCSMRQLLQKVRDFMKTVSPFPRGKIYWQKYSDIRRCYLESSAWSKAY